MAARDVPITITTRSPCMEINKLKLPPICNVPAGPRIVFNGIVNTRIGVLSLVEDEYPAWRDRRLVLSRGSNHP
ncbi:MAG: hypothetical protein HGA86_07250 [Anaerolineaceae bacterium]|nr:hypothetical protein [Anaerolineaceae bacterium]